MKGKWLAIDTIYWFATGRKSYVLVNPFPAEYDLKKYLPIVWLRQKLGVPDV